MIAEVGAHCRSLCFDPHLHVHLNPQSLLGLTTLVAASPDSSKTYTHNSVASHLLPSSGERGLTSPGAEHLSGW